MKAAWLALAAVMAMSCLPSVPSGRLFGGGPAPAPQPSRAAVLDAGLRADDARSAAFAGGELAGLGSAFAGQALSQIKAAIAHLKRLGQLVERRLDTRHLVHWSAGQAVVEGVLAISGWSRLLDHGAATAWSPFLEEWEFQLEWAGRWRVVQAAEVPPAAWWQ